MKFQTLAILILSVQDTNSVLFLLGPLIKGITGAIGSLFGGGGGGGGLLGGLFGGGGSSSSTSSSSDSSANANSVTNVVTTQSGNSNTNTNTNVNDINSVLNSISFIDPNTKTKKKKRSIRRKVNLSQPQKQQDFQQQQQRQKVDWDNFQDQEEEGQDQSEQFDDQVFDDESSENFNLDNLRQTILDKAKSLNIYILGDDKRPKQQDLSGQVTNLSNLTPEQLQALNLINQSLRDQKRRKGSTVNEGNTDSVVNIQGGNQVDGQNGELMRIIREQISKLNTSGNVDNTSTEQKVVQGQTEKRQSKKINKKSSKKGKKSKKQTNTQQTQTQSIKQKKDGSQAIVNSLKNLNADYVFVNGQKIPSNLFIQALKKSDIYIDGKKLSEQQVLKALRGETTLLVNALKDSSVIVNGEKLTSGSIADVNTGKELKTKKSSAGKKSMKSKKMEKEKEEQNNQNNQEYQNTEVVQQSNTQEAQ